MNSLSLSDLGLHKQNNLKKKFISSLQNNCWQYWPHFQAIQPNASAKGTNALQPSLSSSDIGKPQPSTSINEVNPSPTAVTPLSSNVMSVNPIPATPTITNTSTQTVRLGPKVIGSTGLTGLKTTMFKSSVKKVSELHRSSTAYSPSPISEVSCDLKPLSLISKLPTCQSKNLLAAGLSRNVKLNMMKDLGHAFVAVKDSLLRGIYQQALPWGHINCHEGHISLNEETAAHSKAYLSGHQLCRIIDGYAWCWVRQWWYGNRHALCLSWWDLKGLWCVVFRWTLKCTNIASSWYIVSVCVSLSMLSQFTALFCSIQYILPIVFVTTIHAKQHHDKCAPPCTGST